MPRKEPARYEHYEGNNFYTIYGYYWHDLTTQSIRVKRYMSDTACNSARVRIWVTE